MGLPDRVHINFDYQNKNYNLDLVRGEKSQNSVQMNGTSYAVHGDQDQMETASKILSAVSLESIYSEEDLREKLSTNKEITFPKKVEDIGVAKLGGSPPTTLERVNRYIDALKNSDFYSGLILVAVGNKVRGEVIQPKDLQQKPFTLETPFNILSVGKLFTTIAVMQLVERGLIDLDKPIKSYLGKEDYTLDGCDPIYEEGKLAPRDLEAFMQDENVTVRHLLSHTAGILEEPPPTRYDPSLVGKKYNYSNLGFQLLARIVKNRNEDGVSYVDYVADHIMRASGIEEEDSIKYLKKPPSPDEQPSLFSNKVPSGIAKPIDDRIPNPDGNGCFWMKAKDLYKFADTFMAGELLNDEKSKEILLTPDPVSKRALGFQVNVANQEIPLFYGHPGGFSGASSGLMMIEADEPVTMISLSNFDEGNEVIPELVDVVVKKVEKVPFQKREELRRKEKSPPSS